VGTTVKAELLAAIRTDLKDDPADRWSDATLYRHMEHALREISAVRPRQATADLTVPTPASRTLDLSDLADLISVERVEYPVDSYPPRFRHFEHWANVHRLLTRELPTAGATVRLYYGRPHTLDPHTTAQWQASHAYSTGDLVVPTTGNGWHYECTAAGTSGGAEPSWPTADGETVADGGVTWTCREPSTLPCHYHELVIAGAEGHAALEYAAYVINRVTTGGRETASQFKSFGENRLTWFRGELWRIRRSRIKTGTFYTEDET
jgi:hypothetical protein